jgi:outer membrane lipoprotein-sorting protein
LFSSQKMGVKLMRMLTIAIATAFLLSPAAGPAQAFGAAGLHSAKAATTDYSAATKKKAKKKKEKVEYMRAAPMK